MKRLVIVVTLLSALPVLGVDAGARPRCTINGTAGNDVLSGGAGRDVMCAKGGGDYADVTQGGRDIVRGGNGDDFINARDGETNDLVKAGNGQDTCFKDRGDRVRGCETVAK